LNTATIRESVHRIDCWLSHGPVYCADSGAVAGVTDDEGVVYWYGEIAGYYLAYLASLTVESSKTPTFARHAARQVGSWLQLQWADTPGPTRLYKSANVDWRNDYVFAFDLAMILKGLASIQRCGLDAGDGWQIAEFMKVNLIDERGSLCAIHNKQPGNQPDTWSTSIDGHQLKTAAALIGWGKHFNDHTLCKLGHGLVKNLTRGNIHDWPHLPLHPRLYALEGLLLCKLAKPGSLATVLHNILSTIDLETERTDVIAQLLRLALFAKIEKRPVDRAASHLLKSINMDGSVAFRTNQASNERNTWCAIFTRQALQFYNEARSGRQLKPGLCI